MAWTITILLAIMAWPRQLPSERGKRGADGSYYAILRR